jgi:pimeloyl-ACP methyl ester carboxylesterase
VNPFFFGSSKSPLYGVYHPPKSATGPATAVLLCYPMGAEYMRAHRAFRQLTTLLVKGGAHVLRFDYFGTGDSGGDASEATFARWREDIGTAIEELKEMCQAERVTVIGLRFGATLAAQAVAGRSDVEHLVLWDPIIDGPAYVREMLATHAAEQAARGRAAGDGTAGVHGFPLLPEQRDELNSMTLQSWPSATARRVDVVRSSEAADAEALAARLTAEGSNSSYSVFPSNGNWAESDAFGSALIPQGIIQGIIGKVLESGVAA